MKSFGELLFDSRVDYPGYECEEQAWLCRGVILLGSSMADPGTTCFLCFSSQRHHPCQPCIPRTPVPSGEHSGKKPVPPCDGSSDGGSFFGVSIYPHSKASDTLEKSCQHQQKECPSASVTVSSLDFILHCIHCRAKEVKPLKNLCNSFSYQKHFYLDKVINYHMLNARI